MAFVFFNTQKQTVLTFYYTEECTSVFIVCLLFGINTALQINLSNKRILNAENESSRLPGCAAKCTYAFLYIEKKIRNFIPGFKLG